MRALVLLSAFALLSCRTGETGKGGGAGTDSGGLDSVDGDGDGFVGSEDCDDNDASVNGGATEVCDGIDNDCDGAVDEGVLSGGFLDQDGDGFGDPGEPVEACDLSEGAVSNANDCDDGNDRVFPGAVELCNTIDDDCDTEVDEGLTSSFHVDADGDGYGDPDESIVACEAPPDHVADGSDCDDTTELSHPGATEICDELDNDCDEEVDEGVTSLYYLDVDGDGWGISGSTTQACSRPVGYAEWDGDCDDSDIAYNPGASEPDCTDPNDYNCDGSVAWADDDLDGWVACEECNDADASIHPDATEVCNEIDDDCDGLTDDDDSSLDTSTGDPWYADADADGFGNPATETLACDQPSGTVTDNTDCNDASSGIRPSAVEICDGIDNDCDGLTDDADSSLDLSTASLWYADADGDGYGDPTIGTRSCLAPSSAVANSSDCDDAASAIHPLATEVCDGVDNDCDTDIDDADIDVIGRSNWYRDADSDGYGTGAAVTACFQPSGHASLASDCDDADATANPAGTEVCDHDDEDCDGLVDEGFDADGDSILDCDEISYTVSWTATGDDIWNGYVDGVYQGQYGGWSSTNTITVTLDSGRHVLASYVWDTGAAIAGWLAVVYVNGSLVSRTGDGSWLYTRSPGSGWTGVSYSSSGWGTPVPCDSGQVSAHWGSTPTSLTGLGARWVWFSSNCSALGDAYFRYELTLP